MRPMFRLQERLLRIRGLAPVFLAFVAGALSNGALAAQPVSAESLIDLGRLAMRIDPEASRRDAEAALSLLGRTPNAALEIRARMIRCDYQAERDSKAAQEQIDRALALIANAQNKGLRAGVLVCQGDLNETAGDNVRALSLYNEAVAVA